MERRTSPEFLDRVRKLTRVDARVVAWARTAAHVWGAGVTPFAGETTPWPLEFIAPPGLDLVDGVVEEGFIQQSDVGEHLGIRLTTRERTAVDCAAHLPRLEAVAALDQLLRAGVRRDDLARRAAALRLDRDRRRVRDRLALADPGAASPRETWIRVILTDAHLPRPRAQIPVRLGGGRLRHLDLGWEQYKVATEYDGREHHSAPADLRCDDSRRAELRAHGWRVIPVRRDVIPSRTGDYIEQVANALLERGWQPSSEHLLRVLAHIRAARRRRS